MRRELPTIVLSVFEVLLVALGGGFYVRVRPHLLIIYDEAGAPLTWSAELALSTWLVPTLLGSSIALCALAFLQPKRGLRLRWLGAANGLAGASFVAVVLASYVPLLT